MIRLSQEAVNAYENRHSIILEGGEDVDMPVYENAPAPVSYDEVAPPAIKK